MTHSATINLYRRFISITFVKLDYCRNLVSHLSVRSRGTNEKPEWFITGLTSLPLTCFLPGLYGFLWFLAHFLNQTAQLWYSSPALVHRDPVFQRTISPRGKGLTLCQSMSGWYCAVHPARLYLKAVVPKRDIHLPAEKLIPALVNSPFFFFNCKC